MRTALVVCSLLVPLSTLVSAETSVLRGDDWLPYNMAPTEAKQGFLIDIAKAVWEPHGYTIDYQLASWARAVKDTQDGKIDVLVGAGEGDAEGLLFSSVSQAHSDNHCITLPSSTWTFADPSSLEAITLGVVKDYTYVACVDERVARKTRFLKPPATGRWFN